jgi:uncharacterized protein (TIGR02246 family)
MENEIRELMSNQFAAIRDKDIERLMALYADDIVYFDVVPPLRFAGSEAVRERFVHWFEGFDGPIDVEVRDVAISVYADSAVTTGFSRAKGTLKNGREIGVWVRITSCARRLDKRWLVTHEHVSVPVDMATGRPALDLTP